MAGVTLILDRGTERLFRTGAMPWLTPNPVKVTAIGDRVTVEAWKSFKGCVKRYLRIFQGNLFSQEALDALKQAVSERLTLMGYETTTRRVWEYAYTSPDAGRILSTTVPVKEVGEEIKNDTECDLGALRDLDLPAYVTIEDGRAVSVAACNGHPDEDGVCEVGMETYAGARGRGYATSNLAALTQALIQKGVRVVASAEEENIASHRVLLRAGFEKIGESVYYLGEKNGI